ncbi:MAG: hypothetical protein ACRD3T_10705 [Terriglobia bacterium]
MKKLTTSRQEAKMREEELLHSLCGEKPTAQEACRGYQPGREMLLLFEQLLHHFRGL